MSEYTTVFGSLDDYEKGRVIVIDDDPKAYVFSNVFEVANSSKPYEKVAVGKNLEYVLEVIRCEGMSEWRVTPHDEFALVMGGTVVIESIYALPGLGTLLLSAVITKDYTLIQGIVLFFAILVVTINIVVDLSYAFFDPRVRYS